MPSLPPKKGNRRNKAGGRLVLVKSTKVNLVVDTYVMMSAEPLAKILTQIFNPPLICATLRGN